MSAKLIFFEWQCPFRKRFSTIVNTLRNTFFFFEFIKMNNFNYLNIYKRGINVNISVSLTFPRKFYFKWSSFLSSRGSNFRRISIFPKWYSREIKNSIILPVCFNFTLEPLNGRNTTLHYSNYEYLTLLFFVICLP